MAFLSLPLVYSNCVEVFQIPSPSYVYRQTDDRHSIGTLLTMKNASRRSPSPWLIACLCSFINFVQLGTARLSGLLYLAALPRYNADRSQASFPFVLCYTVRNVSGPFIGFLGRKFGAEAVTIAGCVISSIGIGTCFFAEDIETVTVLWGGVYGLGFGMGSILLPEVLNQHFDKYITNANGISLGGECVAGFLLPVLVESSLNSYGTSGTFLILSGLALHSVPAALLLRLPVRILKSTITTKSRCTNRYIASTGDESKCTLIREGQTDGYSTTTSFRNQLHEPNSTLETVGNYPKTCVKYEYCDPTSSYVIKRDVTTGIQSEIAVERSSTPINISAVNVCTDASKYQHLLESCNQAVVAVKHSNNPEDFEKSYKSIHLNNDDSFCRNAPIPSSSSKIASRTHTSPFLVFLDPSFILIAITQSSVIFIGTMFLTIIVDLSRDAGVDRSKEVYILMSYSVADTIGRFCLGWITDGGYLSNVVFSMLCYTCMGVVLSISVSLTGLVAVMVSALMVGLCIGGLLIVFPGIVSHYIEHDQITMALASRFFLYAPMSFTQSYLIGFFRGELGSYNGIIYILAVTCFMCSVLTLAIPCVGRFRDRKKKITVTASVKECANDSTKTTLK